MKIRIMGNSASGKTTLARRIAEYFNVDVLHLDSIAFVPSSNYELKSDEEIVAEYQSFCKSRQNYIIDGNYLNITSSITEIYDLVIFIDLPIDQTEYNFKNRYFEFENSSRPELPNIIGENYEEMMLWINNFNTRRLAYLDYINKLALYNPGCHVINLNDMPEVRALCQKPEMLEEIF